MQMRSRQRQRYHTCRTTSTCRSTPPSSATRPSAEGQASYHQSCPHLCTAAVGGEPREARGGGEGGRNPRARWAETLGDAVVRATGGEGAEG